MSDTAKLLRKAAQVLRERGWCQGDYVDDKGCLCVYGACIVASGIEAKPANSIKRFEDWAIVRKAEDLVAEPLRKAAGVDDSFSRTSVNDWNDDPARTVDEVLDALERAAVIAESAGQS